MIPYRETKGEVVFSHEDADGTQRMFAVQRIIQFLTRSTSSDPPGIRLVLVPLEKDFANWMLINRGIEPHRLIPLIGFSTLDPVIFCAEEDTENSHLLIDGSHRYVAATINENTHIRAYILAKSIWEQFLIDAPRFDIMKTVQKYSGL